MLGIPRKATLLAQVGETVVSRCCAGSAVATAAVVIYVTSSMQAMFGGPTRLHQVSTLQVVFCTATTAGLNYIEKNGTGTIQGGSSLVRNVKYLILIVIV